MQTSNFAVLRLLFAVILDVHGATQSCRFGSEMCCFAGVARRRRPDGGGAGEGAAGRPLRALLPVPSHEHTRRLRIPLHAGARRAGLLREPPRLRGNQNDRRADQNIRISRSIKCLT